MLGAIASGTVGGYWEKMKVRLLDNQTLREFVALDERAVVEAQAHGCPYCGSPLFRADYRRKPRGLPVGTTGWDRRFSLCCGAEGCRRRVTPPSVRFLGRRLYPAPWVVLAVAYAQAARTLRIARRTLRRWSAWWQTRLPVTPAWVRVRGLLAAPVDESALPGSLLNHLRGPPGERIMALLRLVAGPFEHAF